MRPRELDWDDLRNPDMTLKLIKAYHLIYDEPPKGGGLAILAAAEESGIIRSRQTALTLVFVARCA